jgi:hypothetical protein
MIMPQNDIRDKANIEKFISEHVNEFCQQRIQELQQFTLSQIALENSYLLKLQDRYFFDASCLVGFWLDTALLSNDTILFDKFLENTTISLFTQLFQWKKSLRMEHIIYLETPQSLYIAYIKPRINSSATRSIKDSIKALQVEVQQLVNPKNKSVQPVLGVCWGPNIWVNAEGILFLSGRSFWSLVDDGEWAFNKILAAFSLSTVKHSEIYHNKKAAILNSLTREFLEKFCDVEGAIDWSRLIGFNSGNFDLDKFGK